MKYVKSYRELEVYLVSMSLAAAIFEFSRSFPKEEMYSLTDQVRRSSRAIGAQIAEAWAKRRYERHFVSKLTDALGEQFETQHWLETAKVCGYISDEAFEHLIDLSNQVGRMLSVMINKSALFCHNMVKPQDSTTDTFSITD